MTIFKLSGLARGAIAAIVALSAIGVESSTVLADQRDDRLVKAYNKSGFELFEKLAQQPGNVIMSPYGIGSAMAMTFTGARGETEGGMAAVLGHTLPREMIADANHRLEAVVTKRSGSEDAKIVIANALHFKGSGSKVAPSYKDVLSEKFAAELFSGSDVAAINDWVGKKTGGRIESLLSRLDPNSVCVILNAVHFQSSWASAFEEKSTAPGEFRLSKHEIVKVPTMRQTGRFRITTGDSFDAIALPYKGEKLTMTILLPRRPAAAGKAVSLNGKSAKAAMDALREARIDYVRLSMPKFKSEFAADLIPPFKSLGLAAAFDRDKADFSGITESETEADRIHITQIRHKAFIDVNEAGTEAAGATAVEFATRSVATAPKAFKVDRPFLYLIADSASGAILFMGRVSDPRK